MFPGSWVLLGKVKVVCVFDIFFKRPFHIVSSLPRLHQLVRLMRELEAGLLLQKKKEKRK